MRRIGITVIFALPFLGYAQGVESENMNNTSTDAQVIELSDNSKRLELIAIFNDAIDAPTEYNEYVIIYLEEATFPSKNNQSQKEYDLELNGWISENPSKVEQLLADRKEAHDQLYGPRKN